MTGMICYCSFRNTEAFVYFQCSQFHQTSSSVQCKFSVILYGSPEFNTSLLLTEMHIQQKTLLPLTGNLRFCHLQNWPLRQPDTIESFGFPVQQEG